MFIYIIILFLGGRVINVLYLVVAVVKLVVLLVEELVVGVSTAVGNFAVGNFAVAGAVAG